MDSADEPVDVSVLEALIDVRKQQALVDQFCAARRGDEGGGGRGRSTSACVGDYAKRRDGARRRGRAARDARPRRVPHAARRCTTACSARTTRRNSTRTRSCSGTRSARSTRRAGTTTRAPERTLAESAERLATLEAHDARFREALPDVDLSVAEPTAPARARTPPDAFEPVFDRRSRGGGDQRRAA